MDCLTNLTDVLLEWESCRDVFLIRCYKFLSEYKKNRGYHHLSSLVEGKGFNPLGYFNIGEREHSQILADLLDPAGSHGHESLFLKEFLVVLGIPALGEDDRWEVWAEAGRVDVLLKRRHPHSVIVIENKSNNARDQDHQLYRYWYQEIYWPLRHSGNYDYKARETYLAPEIKQRYRVIYLPTDESKAPSDISLAKPGWPVLDSSFPDTMPIDCEVQVYGKFIKMWLGGCLPGISSLNYRLRGFIQAYIDFWSN